MATKKFKVKKKIILSIIIIGILALAALYIIFRPSTEEDLTSSAIAVISINGPISIEESGGSLLSPETGTGSNTIAELIKKAEKAPEVKAIIFEINSPGGTVVASEEMANAVKSAKKPTVALMREVAASGGYWVASACDKIVADPATITGSIGVTGSYLQYSGLMEKYGITYERLVSGQYKDTASPYKELTPAERDMMMKKINSINSLFINAISQNRNLNKSYVSSLATGEIFLGTEAKELGLVDYLGGAGEAKAVAEQLANVTKSRLVSYEKKKTLWDVLKSSSTASAYWMGRGIGDAWNLLSEKESTAIKAEL